MRAFGWSWVVGCVVLLACTEDRGPKRSGVEQPEAFALAENRADNDDAHGRPTEVAEGRASAAGVAAQSAGGLPVTERFALPFDGTPLDLRGWLGPDRTLVLEGAVSSRIDGTEVDAFARRVSGIRFESDGPFVFLPSGTELVEEDRLAHRYVVRLPEGTPPVVAFAIGRLAARQLQTRSEAAAALYGRIEVQVRGPLADAAATKPSLVSRAASAPFGSLAGLGILSPMGLLPAGMWMRRRRRTHDHHHALKRVRRAARRIDHEARRLGPAFDGVVVVSRALVERAEGLVAHHQEIERASRRIAGVGAQRQRQGLASEAKGVRANLEALAGYLEGVAAELAAEVAGHARVRDLADRLGEMSSELELALAADREVDRRIS